MRCAETEISPTTKQLPGAGQKDAISALVDQLHGGVQLRSTSMGNRIRGMDSSPGQYSARYILSPV